MKNSSKCNAVDLGAPFTQMQPAELVTVNGGGIAPVLLGVPFVFKSIYDMGVAFGRELYHIQHH